MDAETKTGRCPLWVKIVLALSLALNLAIAGLVAGTALRGGAMAGRMPAMGYAMPYVLALPRDSRREVFRSMHRDRDLPDRAARRAEYRAMIAALKATPFDVAAVEAVLDRQADGASRVQAAAQAAWLAAVAQFSDEERLDYTARIEDALKRRGPRNR